MSNWLTIEDTRINFDMVSSMRHDVKSSVSSTKHTFVSKDRPFMIDDFNISNLNGGGESHVCSPLISTVCSILGYVTYDPGELMEMITDRTPKGARDRLLNSYPKSMGILMHGRDYKKYTLMRKEHNLIIDSGGNELKFGFGATYDTLVYVNGSIELEECGDTDAKQRIIEFMDNVCNNKNNGQNYIIS